MFVTVKTKDGDCAAVNVDQITYMTIAAFSGAGSKIYFTSNGALSVCDSMDSLLLQINGNSEDLNRIAASAS